MTPARQVAALEAKVGTLQAAEAELQKQVASHEAAAQAAVSQAATAAGKVRAVELALEAATAKVKVLEAAQQTLQQDKYDLGSEVHTHFLCALCKYDV